jgi:hypothetical protein
LIAFLKRMLAHRRADEDRVVIDQNYDDLEARLRRAIELARAIEKGRDRIALTVGSWARGTISNRAREVIPRSVRRDV